jgi:tetratricopeptide (TPR) repeat protein
MSWQSTSSTVQRVGLALGLLAWGEAFGAAAESGKPAACQRTLWGCVDSESSLPDGATPLGRYERLLASARQSLGPLRLGLGLDFDAAAQKLTEATLLLPSAPEAHSLLGQLLLERGQNEAAAPSLRRAEELLLQSEGAAAAPLELLDPGLGLALGLLAAQEGDLSGGLERYLRLLRSTAPSHRLLYRSAEVLMALGRLDEATALLERACSLARSNDTHSFDIARACRSYVAALDRSERVAPPLFHRRIHIYDREDRALRYSDFVPAAERDYQRALSLPLGCERRLAFERYLQAAAPTTPPATTGGSARPVVPAAYLRRAEAHLRTLSRLVCPSGGG